MPTLVSHVPKLQADVPLIDFDGWTPQLVTRPPAAKLGMVWEAVEATERRLWMFDVLTISIANSGYGKLLIQDMASAYLLSLEAALQILKNEFETTKTGFDNWLLGIPENDYIFKGLRDLRAVAAHVRSVGLWKGYNDGSSPLGSIVIGGQIVSWRWPDFSHHCPGRPKLKNPGELAQWNTLVQDRLVRDLMHDGVLRLSAIAKAAESAI
jgi:hypothetical protein